MNTVLTTLTKIVENEEAVKDEGLAIDILENENYFHEYLTLARNVRKKNFGNRIQVHIINNIRNGFCPEDCSYCAQRSVPKTQASQEKGHLNDVFSLIHSYPEKSDTEILKEAEKAWVSGAYRYCLVSAGRGPSRFALERYAKLIREIKNTYPIQVCLSAGLVTNEEDAKILADVGLDRYNHNLNSTEEHYSSFCTTHTYQDRIKTLENMQRAGVPLCSGFIAGLGESTKDIVRIALSLNEKGVVSIPVNFFLPVDGHAVVLQNELSPEYCLRILCLLRLTNPRAELRVAAGREYYLKDRQREALGIINSLFVSGYLNVKGSSIEETYAMIQDAGFEIETRNENVQLKNLYEDSFQVNSGKKITDTNTLSIKSISELRPFK